MSAPKNGNGAHDWTVSMVRAAHVTETTEASFREVMDEIASPRWKGAIEAIRQAYAAGWKRGEGLEPDKQTQAAKDAASEPKKKLPAVLFSGTFSRRAASALTISSGLICVDLDELGDRVEQVRDLIVSDPHTLGAFISPTGTGLKVIFRVDPAKPHLESFKAAERFVLEHFGLEVDQACKDVSRMCFVSHDPECFAANDAEILPYPAVQPVEFKPSGLHTGTVGELTPGDDYDLRGDFKEVLLAHGWTKLGEHGWTRPGKTTGVSATFDKVPGRFYVFSSSTEFETNHTYRPWHIFALLECGGDFTKAARELGAKGYGEQKQRKGPRILDEEGNEVMAKAELVARPITSFRLLPSDDRSILVGRRWLCRGDGAILSSTSGTGKSTLSIQLAFHWALGRMPFNAFRPHGPLTSLILQSEDSEGDVAEIQSSMCEAMTLSEAEKELVGSRVMVVTDRVNRGLAFLKELKRLIALHQPDIVWINPMLAFMGGDINDAEAVGNFLRGGLNGLNEPATHAYIIIHHTAKPPKEKADRKWNEMMYDMAGSADLTNWARAILSLRAGENEGEFNLVLAKRGVRAGATELKPGTVNSSIKYPTPTITIPVRHSTQRFTPPGGEDMPMIYWETMDKPVSEGAKSPAGRKKKYSVEDLAPCFPRGLEKALGFRALHNFAKEIKPNIGTGTFEDVLIEAQERGLIKVDKSNPRQPRYYAPVEPDRELL